MKSLKTNIKSRRKRINPNNLNFATSRTNPNPFCKGKEELALIPLKENYTTLHASEKRSGNKHATKIFLDRTPLYSKQKTTLIYQKITLISLETEWVHSYTDRLASNAYPHERSRSRVPLPAHGLRSSEGEETMEEERRGRWSAKSKSDGMAGHLMSLYKVFNCPMLTWSNPSPSPIA